MKKLVMGTLAAASALVFTGCQMCSAPIVGDPSCIENTHVRGIAVDPAVTEYSKPAFAASKDVFRPVYKAGTERVTAIGSGDSLEDATADAVSQILVANKCDYLVAVTRIITKKTHPTGLLRFFATTNYTVTISGLPVFLDKLEKVVAVETVKVEEKKGISAEDVMKLIDAYVKAMPKPEKKCCPPPFAQIQLTDINLSMTAKATSDKPVAVAVPAPAPKPVPVK